MKRINSIIDRIKPLDKKALETAKERQDTLTKPRRSLGILEDLSLQVAGITGNPLPEIVNKVIVIMAGDHGVTEEGVSAYPQEVTLQMVHNFIKGGAGINVLANHVGARTVVVDTGIAGEIGNQPVIKKKIARGTKNMTKGPAMSGDDAVRSIEAGIDVVEGLVEDGVDIMGTGDMGIGNTTASSAIVAAITGNDVRKVTGRGTGITDAMLDLKVEAIEKALRINNPDPANPVDVLAKIGGFEIGGLAGAIMAGAANRIPVVIDGFISGAAALIAVELAPLVKNYLIAAHRSVEIGHGIILDHLGLRALLDLNMRLGEGTGAALGISLVEASCKMLTDMATFASAGVSRVIDQKTSLSSQSTGLKER